MFFFFYICNSACISSTVTLYCSWVIGPLFPRSGFITGYPLFWYSANALVPFCFPLFNSCFYISYSTYALNFCHCIPYLVVLFRFFLRSSFRWVLNVIVFYFSDLVCSLICILKLVFLQVVSFRHPSVLLPPLSRLQYSSALIG